MNMFAAYGRIASDINMKYLENTTVASFTVAVNRRGKDAGADFFRFKAFGKTAELMEKRFRKGNRVAITASAKQPDRYQNKDGKIVYPNVEFHVQTVDFVDTKAESERLGSPREDEDGFMTAGEISTEDLPFK